MKAIIVTLDPETLEPDQDIQQAVGEALSGRLRIQWNDVSWDFDVTPIIDEDGRHARVVLSDVSGDTKGLRLTYERPDGTIGLLEPTDFSA